MVSSRFLWLLMAWAWSPLLMDARAAETLKGTLFEIGTRNPIYRIELQGPGREQPSRHVRAEYRTLAGKPVLQEEAVYAEGVLQEYSLRQLQTGEEARTIFHDGKVNFLKRKGEEESAASEDLTPETLINDQIEGYVAKHWDELKAGKALPIRFVVPLRKETIGFTLSKEEEKQWKTPAVKTLVVAMKAQSFFIRLFLDPIYLTFEAKAPHRLLGVQGRTALKAESDPEGDDIDAALEFDR